MLNLMRKHARNWIMKALLAIIIIVFVFYFGSQSGKETADTIVTIDGKTLSRVDFDRSYQDLIDMYRQRAGGQLTEEMLKAMKVKDQVLDKMIYEALLLKKAEELRIRISDQDLQDMIAATPAFQRNGVFSQKQYEQMLRYNRMKPEDFEAKQRRVLTISKMEDLLQDGIFVSDTEVYNFYKTSSAKVNLLWTRLSAKDFQKDVRPSAADIEKYLKDHEAAFRVPEQVQVKYILFSGQTYGEEMKVSEEEITETYNRVKGQVGKDAKMPPLAAVRGKILRDLKQSKGMRLAYEAAKKAHDEIYQQNNFDAYAAKTRLPLKTTGFFTAKNLPEDLRSIRDVTKIAFGLRKDDISNVLSAENGYYILTFVAQKAAYSPALKDIEPDVRRRFVEDESKRLARQEAERLLVKMKNGDSLKTLAAGRKLAVAETGLFLPSAPPAQLGRSPELSRTFFQLSPKKTYADQVFDTEGGYLLIEFKERATASDQEFAEKKPALKEALTRVKKGEVIQAWMEATKAAMAKEGRIKFHKEVKDL